MIFDSARRPDTEQGTEYTECDVQVVGIGPSTAYLSSG